VHCSNSGIERPKVKRSIVLIIAVLLFAALSGGLGYLQFVVKPQLIKSFIAAAGSAPVSVAVTEAVTETWAQRLPAIGTFRAVQGIDVAPQIGGRVVAVKVQSGDDVEKGTVLFEIDHSVEEADLKNYLATLKNANLALERQQKLTLSGNTAKANLDSAEAARDTALASVERVRATIAQKMLAAPFSGRLGIRKIDLGQYVSPGTSLITLQQLDPIYVDFPIPEKSLALLKDGQTIEVEVDAYPGRIFRGRIVTIDARIALDSRNVWVRGELENHAKELLPGMFANVNVIAGEPVTTVTLPRTAVNYSLYGDNVYVVVPAAPSDSGSAQAAPLTDVPQQVERRFVRLGDIRGDRVAILEGVKAGEMVVTEGQLKLQAGTKVRIDPNAGLEPPPVRPKE
jgi:membrane fusion protein (multidrug efflux system)